jgi:hypothetical protein
MPHQFFGGQSNALKTSAEFEMISTTDTGQILGDMLYTLYDAVDSCMMTASYGAEPYHMPYCLKKVFELDRMVTVAIIWVPSGHWYSDGIQPYSGIATSSVSWSYFYLLVRACRTLIMWELAFQDWCQTMDFYSPMLVLSMEKRYLQLEWHKTTPKQSCPIIKKNNCQ